MVVVEGPGYLLLVRDVISIAAVHRGSTIQGLIRGAVGEDGCLVG